MRPASLALATLALGAACTPPAEQPTAAVDTAAVQTELDSLRNRYIALDVAGDAAGLAALFEENAGIDLYGLPRLRGRAAIEAAFTANFAMRRYEVVEITPLGLEARTATEASEVGTFHTLADSSGTKQHEWGRYLAAFMKGADNQWRLIYLIGFPDSVKVGP
jgi:ketosteroid isomerase-like protein